MRLNCEYAKCEFTSLCSNCTLNHYIPGVGTVLVSQKKRNDSFDSKVYQVQTKSRFLLMTLKLNGFQVTGLLKLEGLNYVEQVIS